MDICQCVNRKSNIRFANEGNDDIAVKKFWLNMRIVREIYTGSDEMWNSGSNYGMGTIQATRNVGQKVLDEKDQQIEG